MLLQRLTANPIMAGSLAALFLILPQGLMYLLFPLQLIAPLPILLLGMRSGVKDAGLACLVPALFSLTIMGQFAWPLIMTFILMVWFALLAIWLLRGGWRPVQVLGGGYFLALGLLILFLLGSMLMGGGPLDSIHDHMMGIKKEIIDSLSASKEFDAKLTADVGRSMDDMFKLFAMLFPALFLSSWYVVQVGNLLLARHILKRWDMPLMAEQDMASLRIPFFLVWPLIASGVLAFATSGAPQQFGFNLALFLVVPYFFQGYSVIQKGFVHYKVSVFFRAIFYVLLLSWSTLLLLVTVLGLFDTWLDFRSRLTGGESSL